MLKPPVTVDIVSSVVHLIEFKSHSLRDVIKDYDIINYHSINDDYLINDQVK